MSAVKELSIQSESFAVHKSIVQPDMTIRLKLYLFVKRLTDILGGCAGLIVFLPVFILVPILIKLNDPEGPVFFSQIRVGQGGKVFRMYKFRSMVVHAEDMLDQLLEQNEVTGAMFKMRNDPRVTAVGRFLRRTSLDELPQFINVLKGDMSLVGPRPPLPREVAYYSAYHFQRLLVRPGCTGLWQVRGRSHVGFEAMVKMDLMYIEKRGFRLDSQIIIQTIGELFHSNSAC